MLGAIPLVDALDQWDASVAAKGCRELFRSFRRKMLSRKKISREEKWARFVIGRYLYLDP